MSYDPLSRLASLTHDLDAAVTSHDVTMGFAYNPASQIVTRSLSNEAYEFALTNANRVYAVNGLNQYTQITGSSSATLSWDANGNLTSDGATAFGYDTENRLVNASGAKNASLSYDPLGRLSEVTSASGTTRFVYDGDRLIAEYDGSGTLLRRYVHGSGVDEPLVWYEGASVSASSRRYLHANHQGSIVAVTGATGTTLQVNGYDPYGITNASNTGRFQYTGQAALPELGLYYYKARLYNPALGRFMQTDPIGYDDDLNLYAYVGNDPLDKTDPTGTPVFDDQFFKKTAAQQLKEVTVPILNEGKREIGEAAHAVSETIKDHTSVSGKVALSGGIGVEAKVTADRQTFQDGTLAGSVKAQQTNSVQATASATLDVRVTGPSDLGPVKAGISARAGIVGAEVSLGANGAIQSKISLGPQIGFSIRGPQTPAASASVSGRFSPEAVVEKVLP